MAMTKAHARVACLLVTAALAACGDASGPGGVARVVVSPDAPALWVGDTLRLTAEVRGADGEPRTDAVTWRSSDAAVATVDAGGRVTAVGAGEASISATAGGRTGEVEVTVSAYDVVYDARPAGDPELFILSLDGGGPVAVRAPGSGWAADPTPSPDGRRIAFVVRGETADIWVMNRDGSGLTRLTDAPEDDDQPDWSPDGTRIVFHSTRTGRLGDIWVMNADGSQQRPLTTDPLPGVVDEMRPAWSPDGTHIAYASTAAGDVDLWVMRADGTGARSLTRSEDYDTEPAWSPDGTRIAFRRSDPVLGSDVMVIDADGGVPVRLSVPSFQRQPEWTPDGRRILFATGDGPGDVVRLYVMDANGGNVRLLTTDPSWGGGTNPAILRRTRP